MPSHKHAPKPVTDTSVLSAGNLFQTRPFQPDATNAKQAVQRKKETAALTNGFDLTKIQYDFSPPPISSLDQPLQAKLTIRKPNNQYEQEADRVAHDVVQRSSDRAGVNNPPNSDSKEDVSLRDLIRDLNRPVRSQLNQPPMPPITGGFDLTKKVLESGPPLNPSYGLPLQAKLTIGAPNDKYEQESDRVAKQVVQRLSFSGGKPSAKDPGQPPQPNQTLQRETLREEEDELQMKPLAERIQRVELPEEDELQMKPLLQRQGSRAVAASNDLESAIQQSRGSGKPLADSIREPMEQAFGGVDFRGVKVHTDGRSDQLNHSIQAKAFTTGQDIFFRKGAYHPENSGGQELIAHELTHVMQQNSSMQMVQRKLMDISEFEQTMRIETPTPSEYEAFMDTKDKESYRKTNPREFVSWKEGIHKHLTKIWYELKKYHEAIRNGLLSEAEIEKLKIAIDEALNQINKDKTSSGQNLYHQEVENNLRQLSLKCDEELKHLSQLVKDSSIAITKRMGKSTEGSGIRIKNNTAIIGIAMHGGLGYPLVSSLTGGSDVTIGAATQGQLGWMIGDWLNPERPEYYAPYYAIAEPEGSLGLNNPVQLTRYPSQSDCLFGNQQTVPYSGEYGFKYLGAVKRDDVELITFTELKSGWSYKSSQEDLFPHTPSLEDIKQGQLADCALLSVLISVVKTDAKHIQDMMVDNRDGTVTVRFYDVDHEQNQKTFSQRKVTIQKTTVIDSNQDDVFAKTGASGGALWVPILEKAYVAAGFVGASRGVSPDRSYGNIESSGMDIAFEHVLGREAVLQDIQKDYQPGQGQRGTSTYTNAQLALFRVFKDAIDNKKMMTVETDAEIVNRNRSQQIQVGHSGGEPKAKGLVGGHAYSVLDYKPKSPNPGDKLFITLGNPWGEYGREYDWQNKGQPNSAVAKEQNSGQFDIELSDLVKRFKSYAMGK